MRKIDWALNGADSIDLSVPGTLSVNKNDFPSNPIIIDSSSDRAQITIGSVPPVTSQLTGDWVKITGLTFLDIPAVPPKPAGVTAKFEADGKLFEMTKYLRK